MSKRVDDLMLKFLMALSSKVTNDPTHKGEPMTIVRMTNIWNGLMDVFKDGLISLFLKRLDGPKLTIGKVVQ